MKFDDLLNLVADDPVFSSSLLLAGEVDPGNIRLQLARWVKSGRIYQLRKGLYSIAPPYRKVNPHSFLVANQLQKASYVSLQSALSYYGLIPETVNAITSVSTGRPEQVQNPLGTFIFRHIKTALLFGYQNIEIDMQNFLIATPEKALLDLIYLQPGAESSSYLSELRLQNLERLHGEELDLLAEKFNNHKIKQAVQELKKFIMEDITQYEEL